MMKALNLGTDLAKELQLAKDLCKKYSDHIYTTIGFNTFTHLASQNPSLGCDQLFYLQMEIPYEYRFSKFYFKRDLKKEEEAFNLVNPNNEPYIFIHDNPQIGAIINRDTPLKVIKNNPKIGIFHFGKILENAEEVHLMESSLRCLIEDPRLNVKGKLFYHHSVRGGYNAVQHKTTRHKWEVV